MFAICSIAVVVYSGIPSKQLRPYMDTCFI